MGTSKCGRLKFSRKKCVRFVFDAGQAVQGLTQRPVVSCTALPEVFIEPDYEAVPSELQHPTLRAKFYDVSEEHVTFILRT